MNKTLNICVNKVPHDCNKFRFLLQASNPIFLMLDMTKEM